MHRREKPNPLLIALSNALAKAANKSYQPKSMARRFLSGFLELMFFVLLTYGGWQISSVACTFIAAGSCLVLAWHVGSGGTPEPAPDPTMR